MHYNCVSRCQCFRAFWTGVLKWLFHLFVNFARADLLNHEPFFKSEFLDFLADIYYLSCSLCIHKAQGGLAATVSQWCLFFSSFHQITSNSSLYFCICTILLSISTWIFFAHFEIFWKASLVQAPLTQYILSWIEAMSLNSCFCESLLHYQNDGWPAYFTKCVRFRCDHWLYFLIFYRYH